MTVRGNCGTAHVELNNTSTHLQYQMKTGFTVSPPAVEYGWSVYIDVGGSWALTANATLCSSGPASELTRIF